MGWAIILNVGNIPIGKKNNGRGTRDKDEDINNQNS